MRPLSTYRLQIRPAFDLDAAAAVAGYLHDLGVDWAYLSPLLRATSGSDHGYDVVDPSQVDPARGGAAGLERFARAARTAGLGILIDIVPNHMGVSKPAENPWWWDVLTHGRDSPYADAFDIDWEFGAGRLRVPILGAELDKVVAAGELTVDPMPTELTPFGALRYFDHILPLAPGSLDGLAEGDVPAVLERQHWEPVFWRDEATRLNYRRFFTITALAGVRVEVPWVFDETHAEILRWVREGLADGLRVDHPDGLVDPGGYLERLAEATGGAYVLVEKILEHAATDHPEQLPAWWHTDGTTGYDAMAEIDRVLIDPSGERMLQLVDAAARRESGQGAAVAWPVLIHATKRMVADESQAAEVRRLVRCLPEGIDGSSVAQDAIAELLACFPVYRSYLPGGAGWLDAAAALASAHRPDLAEAIAVLVPVLADPTLEVARRFQQVTGPVMAKGVEDMAFYRQTRLGSLTEVGGDPSVFALSVDGFHRAQTARQSSWPHTMTTLSTHDTKRGEDVRARLSVIAELAHDEWAAIYAGLRARATTGHAATDSLLFQAAIGAWPISRERLHAYAEKAAREGGERTSWRDPDAAFEAGLRRFVDDIFDDAVLHRLITSAADRLARYGWSNSLAAKLLQVAGPGVPDVYQGSELWETSLADPDNRRPVDFALRRRLLAGIDAGGSLPPIDESGAAKLLVTSRALRLRRDRPELFSRYTPMTLVGEASGHAIAFDRGGVVAVATRLPLGLERRGGWGQTALLRHAGPTVDVLTGRRYTGTELALRDLLSSYPVALLAAEEVA